MTEQARIQSLAQAFREAMVALREEQAWQLADFPRGACGDASDVLGFLLLEKGLPCHYVCGQRGAFSDGTWVSHAWLERGPLIIDVTADQFPDGRSPVIVAADSAWHAGFSVEIRRVADFRTFDEVTVHRLDTMYRRVIDMMAMLAAATSGQTVAG